MHPYTLKNDSSGYALSVNVKNPLPPLDAKQYLEAARLYQVNCGICHGANLDGNGPLFDGGDGPYIAKPATLLGDPVYESMPEGKMFHSITYGKGAMGSYASQLTSEQRWMIVHYVKEKQASKTGGAGGAAADTTAGTPGQATDTTAAAAPSN
jgi:mono/diheme cytochrome c family protein